jgi:hypothetical protein
LLIELYEEKYGIANHSDPQRPLSSIAYHPTEDIYTDSAFEKHVEKFAYLEVYKKTGLSLTEFLSLSRVEIKQIYRALERKTKMELSETDRQIRELENKQKRS